MFSKLKCCDTDFAFCFALMSILEGSTVETTQTTFEPTSHDDEIDDEIEPCSSSSVCGGAQVPFCESEKVAIIQALIEFTNAAGKLGVKNAAICKQVADKLNKDGSVPSREVTLIISNLF